MSNDYQNQMKGETLAADQAGNAASNEFGTATKELGSQFGLLPAMSIPLDYAVQRQAFFRQEMTRTRTEGPEQPFMNDETIKNSNALKSQKQMLDNYTMDVAMLPQASSAYSQLVPLANNAAKSIAKTDQVGAQLQITTNDQTAQFLNKQHMAALKKAVVAEKLSPQSVASKAEVVGARRAAMTGASEQLARVMNQQVMKKLNEEMEKEQKDKETIEKKIETAEKIAGYLETGASLIAGGAGALAPAAAETAEAESMADTTMKKVQEGAEHTEKGIGIAGKAVGIAMQLYYENQVRALDAKIDTTKDLLGSWSLANEALALDAAHNTMKAATAEYKIAVDQYQEAIDDRRLHMASAGAAADRGQGDQKNSMAMLWIESVMESRSLVATGLTAAQDAKTTLDQVGKQLSDHRNLGWSNIEDIWGSGTTAGTRSEGVGPDVQAIAKMRRLTDNWISGANQMKGYLDKSAGNAEQETGEAGTLAKSGYSGKF